jgi:hypothetical protein
MRGTKADMNSTPLRSLLRVGVTLRRLETNQSGSRVHVTGRTPHLLTRARQWETQRCGEFIYRLAP